MNDQLYLEQLDLECEMRGLSIAKFLKEHQQSDLGDTLTGSFLIRNYISPIEEGINAFLEEASSGKAGRKNSAWRCLSKLPAEVSAFIFVKTLLHRLPIYSTGNRLTLTSLAIQIGTALHDEMRIRKFEEDHKQWFKKVWSDFDRRELANYKRKEYLQAVVKKADEDWNFWSKTDSLHVGVKLLGIFIEKTGDIVVTKVKRGKHSVDEVVPSEGLLAACERIRESREDITAVWLPMVYPPRPWTPETLNRGGYLSHNVTAYPLIKSSKKVYRDMLQEVANRGELDTVLKAVNALQETPWRINTRVLEALDFVYNRNIECGKLPKADKVELPPCPQHIDPLPHDHPEKMEYMRQRAMIHEENRRMIGKRIMAIRTLHTAERFSQYERFYFPHDLDSRGRAYPKPYPLTPQGPDFVKGLLEFADGKPLGDHGLYWLGVHGANCYGEDKLPIKERFDWAVNNLDMIQSIALRPLDDLRWTKADSPVQFLAFCFEFADAYTVGPRYISYLHVDLDATCSGLQHFSAMLRDAVGGFHVNMVPHPDRQDVYGAVASEANSLFERDAVSGDRSGMAQAWLKSGLMDRKVSKRPVMVKPYAGTRQSCNDYVRAAVMDKLKDGHVKPWATEDMFSFCLYGGQIVWEAIPKVVVAADEAMMWLSAIARAVGKSQPEGRRIEWTTPVGLPVWQYKFNMKSRQINTYLNGRRIQPSIAEETDKLDSRQMGSSIPPSFVHSLDAAHLQLTVVKALEAGIANFAMVHDSFGTHAADVHKFTHIIREAFVEMYQQDVLSDFFESARPLIREEFLSDLPPIPERGTLDLNGVLSSEFFFS